MIGAEGTFLERNLALTATEASSGLRCRVGTANVPATYDAERQAVTCMAPKVRV